MPEGNPDPSSEQLLIAITAADNDGVRQALAAGAAIPGDALFDAVKFGDAEMVRLLLDAGADVNVAPWGSALALACGRGRGDEKVALLLDAGADVTAKVHREALSDAINAGRAELAKVLIDRGALRRGQDKARLLADAAAEGLSEIVALLLKSGADPNGRLTDLADHGTALMAAAGAGHLEVVKQLLAAGADPVLKDDKGRDVREWVKKFKPANAKDVLALFD